ncbi:MAG: hypothetical protein HY563_08585 [Ignavibacteriales bacterium]|nr:hypothetical protein [Ignavibacteriales bacterium]
MGNARVIFVGAVSVILGLYSVGLERANRAVARVAEVHAFQMQAEEIAKGGVALAINQMGTSKPNTLPALTGLSMFGGTVSYVVDDQGLAADEARITAQGVYLGHTVVHEAVVKLTSVEAVSKKKKWSNWQAVKTTSKFGAAEFVNQFVSE